MRRNLNKFVPVAAAVLSVMLIFTACSKPTEIKRNEALGKTAEAMMDKEYFTVTVKGAYSNEVSERAFDYTAVIKLLKTESGYDYRAEIATTEGEEVTKRAVVKVGNDLYRCTADGSGEFSSWTKSEGGDDEDDSILAKLSGDTLKSVIGDIDSDEILTEKGGKYTVSTQNDYAEPINKLKEFVVNGENVQAGEYVASSLNENYTREMLVSDIYKTFKEDVKVARMLDGVNDFLGHIGSKKTVENIFDEACKKYNINADDIYRFLKPVLEGNLPNGLELVAPKKGATPYDYTIYKCFGIAGIGAVEVDLLFEKLGIDLTTEQISTKLIELLDDDDVTFGELYERVAAFADPYVYRALTLLGADEDVLSELMEKGALFGTENLKSYEVGKTEITRKTEVSAKDFTVQSFDLGVSADIAYGEEKALLVKTNFTARATFDYKAKVSIVAPI